MCTYVVFFTTDPDSHDWSYVQHDTREEAVAFAFAISDQVEGMFMRRIDPDCDRCLRFDPSDVPHFNCIYHGNAVGHCVGHCTADACY